MSVSKPPSTEYPSPGNLPQGADLKRNIERRHRIGIIWRSLFIFAVVIAIISLLALLFNIVNRSFGLVAVKTKIAPSTLSPDEPLEEMSAEGLVNLLASRDEYPLRTAVVFDLLDLTRQEFGEVARQPVREVLADYSYPEEVADEPIVGLQDEAYQQILKDNLSQEELYLIVVREIVQPEIDDSWTLAETIMGREPLEKDYMERHEAFLAELEAEGKREELAEETNKEIEFQFRSWVNNDFIERTYSTKPDLAGIRTALLGSIWMIVITIVIAFPLGVGAAIYLEEYATDNFINQIIKVNISNLAGVPSIVYGMLGLVIFVRTLKEFTNGSIFTEGAGDGNTIISAAFTMALLILPLIIINSQEAIRAVPPSLRQASYGLGATKWQTVRDHVLPNALPGIMTGTILAVSRALGETAPLIVIGAATRITADPSGPFSRFTVLPIQIFHWTSEPDPSFRNVAAAAILVLLVLLLTLNATAIILRNRFSRRI